MEGLDNSRIAMQEEGGMDVSNSNVEMEQIRETSAAGLSRAFLAHRRDGSGSSRFAMQEGEIAVSRANGHSEQITDMATERTAREIFHLPRHLTNEGSFLDWMRKKTSPRRAIKGVSDLLKLYSPPDGLQSTHFNPKRNARKVFVGVSENNPRLRCFPKALARVPGGLKSYFNWLPEDILRNVVRHVSSRPRSVKWQGHIDPSDVHSLLRSETPLAAVTRRLLPALTTCTDCDGGHDQLFGLFRNGRIQFNNNHSMPNDEGALVMVAKDMDSRILAERLFIEIGPFLQELYIHFHFVNRFNILDYRRFFINLKALHAVESTTFFCDSFDLSLLLRICRGQLRTLDIQGEFLRSKYISAISAYCVGLQDLSLVYRTWQKAMSNVWTSLGPTLERMCLAWPRIIEGLGSMADSEGMSEERAKLCDEISARCVKLRLLELKDTIRRSESLVRIVGNFGSQLRELRMFESRTCLSVKDLKKLLKLCPNIVVDAFVMRDTTRTISVLGAKLRSLRLAVTNQSDLSEAGGAAQNLEYLELYADGRNHEENLTSFLFAPKPKLRSVSLTLGLDIEQMHRKAVDSIAALVSTLEVFSCSLGIDMPTGPSSSGTFQKLAMSNRGLRKVKVKFDHEVHCARGEAFSPTWKRSAKNLTVSFLQDFSVCKILRELVIESIGLIGKSERLARACEPFRGRNADIFLGGIQYFV